MEKIIENLESLKNAFERELGSYSNREHTLDDDEKIKVKELDGLVKKISDALIILKNE